MGVRRLDHTLKMQRRKEHARDEKDENQTRRKGDEKKEHKEDMETDTEEYGP
jgi:hypothetical protein